MKQTFLYCKFLMLLYLQVAKDYIFTFTKDAHRAVRLQPYKKDLAIKANRICGRIHKIVPELPIRLVGSAKFRIYGQNDIDIYVETPRRSLATYTRKMQRVFGTVSYASDIKSKWYMKFQKTDVEITLIDPTSFRYQYQLFTYDHILNRKENLRKYARLKRELKGASCRTYSARKVQFLDSLFLRSKNEFIQQLIDVENGRLHSIRGAV